MVRPQSLAENTEKPNKIEHQEDILEQIQRSNAILVGTIKKLEIELQRKGILNIGDGSFYPVWFLSEQEKNIFLWRKGCSIIEASDYEFWIDLIALINKRRRQLSNGSIHNPFINPRWSNDEYDSDYTVQGIRDKELHYLDTFEGVFKKIECHASAFSIAASDALISDRTENNHHLIRVLLPYSTPSHHSSSLQHK